MCSPALSQIEQRAWEGWRGLPSECTWDIVTERFSPKFEGTVAFHLGTSREPASHQELTVEGFARPVRTWERDQQVVLIEVDATDSDQDLPVRLGPPTGTLDYYFMTSKIEGGALVFPDKGIAVLTNADHTTVLKILLFSPTSLEHYTESLHHPVDPARRLRR